MSKIIAWHILLLFDCKVTLKAHMKMIGRMAAIWLKYLTNTSTFKYKFQRNACVTYRLIYSPNETTITQQKLSHDPSLNDVSNLIHSLRYENIKFDLD